MFNFLKTFFGFSTITIDVDQLETSCADLVKEDVFVREIIRKNYGHCVWSVAIDEGDYQILTPATELFLRFIDSKISEMVNENGNIDDVSILKWVESSFRILVMQFDKKLLQILRTQLWAHIASHNCTSISTVFGTVTKEK